MSQKSEVAVLDVPYKNEACHQVVRHHEISTTIPGERVQRMCPGDLMTCERQRCAQRHVMDLDTNSHTHVLLSGIYMYTV